MFNDYAFIGWVWTCTTHQPRQPDKPDPIAGQWLADLGMTAFGWRFDAACRNGWERLHPAAKGWAEKHLLPLCDEHLAGCLLGDVRTRG